VAFRRIEADLTRRELAGGPAALVELFKGFGAHLTPLQRQSPAQPYLLTNLRLFDGKTLRMQTGCSLLIEGGIIRDIVTSGARPENASVVDCGGLSVIPGLVDCHWHATLVSIDQMTALTADPAFLHLKAAQEAQATLARGFTTVRDMGGPAFALKMAIDRNIVAGPRIFPSGAMISQTAGHGDFRMPGDLPRTLGAPGGYPAKVGVAAIADGAAEVLLRAREQLMRGASQIKIMAGGGVASAYDHLDAVQLTPEEMRAAVQAAEDWGTYVCAHIYTSPGIQRAVRAGVRSIEHAHLADDESVRMMAGEGAWWSIQPFLDDEDANVYPDAERREKQARVAQGTVKAFELADRHKVRMVFGTDILLSPGNSDRQGAHLAKLTRFMPPLAALHLATGAASELLAMSGPRFPYDGPVGVIEKGAKADILVVDGDPENSLDFLADPARSLKLIMKNGDVYKDMIS
jgi:imidazolonepropionase-like amidohydrolase